MRTITKQLVLLAVVFIVYFGYSAWIDGIALYRIAELVSGTLPAPWKIGDFITDPSILNGVTDLNNVVIGTATVKVTGMMAQNSLLYALLSPFKLVLVGGVFAMLIPLTKKLFFGTVIGIKDYIKNRRTNLLYNYQAAINFAQGMKSKLETGDYEQIKAQYAGLAAIKFQPQFLLTMMDEVGYALIRELDMNTYIKPAQVVIDSLKEMYEKERKLAISTKPDEMFHDFKRGYEYVSIGSKYSIAYYKAVDNQSKSKNKLGWKLFSLEMYKFYISMILAIIPTLIVIVIVIPIVSSLLTANVASKVGILLIFNIFMLFSIGINAAMIFTKSQYRLMAKNLAVPATIYYLLMMGIAITFSIGIVAVIQIGDIRAVNSATKMWPFMSAIANLVFTTCLVLLVVATLMDAQVSQLGLTLKLIIDGIVLPLVAWALVLSFNLYGLYGETDPSRQGMWTGIAFWIAAAFWIYLSISGLLLNNIAITSKKRKQALRAELGQQGVDAGNKKD